MDISKTNAASILGGTTKEARSEIRSLRTSYLRGLSFLKCNFEQHN
jgi:hypothetical protein